MPHTLRWPDSVKEPLLKTVMTPFPWSVSPTVTLHDALAMMKQHEVHHLPVCEDHQVLGILSELDTQRCLADSDSSGGVKESRVADVFQRDCLQVDLEQPLRQVLRTMFERHIDAALVLTHGRLAGIFTGSDACRAFADHLDRQFHAGQNDPPEVA